MITPPNNGRPEAVSGYRLRRQSKVLPFGVAILSLGALLCASLQTNAAEPKRSVTRPNQKKPTRLEGNAVWYSVPANSLARRRAGKDELTAAHNRLPLGTKVRVTHLASGKSVIVRITDRGITDRRVLIDLCREAAEKLGMISEGSARVRLELLPEDKPSDFKPDSASW